MNKKDIFVSSRELGQQEEFTSRVRRLCERRQAETGTPPAFYVECYGCQQNEADAERIRGMLSAMGYSPAQSAEDADAVVVNTCAVREHAQQRALGNIGALSHYKRRRPGMIIAVGGCMPQQETSAEKLRRSFPYVDIVFGTHALWRLPEMFYKKLSEGRRVFDTENEDGRIAEGLPALRGNGVRGWVSVMYGCDNFCSYCIVPHVRGRERSRLPEDILAEARALVESGCREINLLGQNVNSYGRGADHGVDFPELLRAVSAIPGDFIVRFMTSHPKDATPRLIDAIADSAKAAPQLHLPVQSGSERILSLMNRNYTPREYLNLINYARERIPAIALTSDIIVGFPGEREDDFTKTLELVRSVRYHSLFTFLYSPRVGTPAAEMPDDTPEEVKKERFSRLLELQNAVSAELHREYIGKRLRVLADGMSRSADFPLSAHSDGGRPVYLAAPESALGKFVTARVVRCSPWALYAEIEGGS